MRLLRFGPGGELNLTKNLIHNIPTYAILSHTWEGDDDEVTLQDIQGTSGRQKPGYRKILSCGKQAQRDGLDYFWADTCCIDKTNNTELAEAINSMFRWYQEAKACYVYLADVHGDDLSRISCNLSFQESRWFTRGWTLQELIAPKALHFYNASWSYLGTKREHASIIETITSVSRPFLLGMASPCETSVAQRMSWASKRTTTRKEDMAYCLMGIFDVSLPMIYGEGDRAFLRLQEEIMRHVQDDSILAWGFSLTNSNTLPGTNTMTRALAISPLDYATSSRIVSPEQGSDATEPIQISGGSLQLQRPIFRDPSGQTFLLLNCHLIDDAQNLIGIPVRFGAAERPTDQYERLLEGPSILLPRVSIKSSPKLIRLRKNAKMESPGADRRYGLYFNNPYERSLKLTEVEPRAWWDQEADLITPLETANDTSQRVLARFSHIHHETLDFIVVLDLGWHNMHPQAAYHVMVSSKNTSLKDVAKYFDETMVATLERHSASDGLMGLHAYLTLKRIGSRTMFELRFDANGPIQSTTNITHDLRNVAFGYQLIGYLRRGQKLTLQEKEWDKEKYTESKTLKETEKRLATVKEEIVKLQNERSQLEGTLQTCSRRMTYLKHMADAVKIEQKELVESVATVQLQLEDSSRDKNQAAYILAQRHATFIEQLSEMSIPTGDLGIDSLPDIRQRLLLNAAYTGDEVLFHCLLSLGVDVETKDLRSCSLLMIAAFGGNIRIMRAILAKEVNEKAKDESGRVALHHATLGDNVSIMELLLERGADIESKSNNGISVLGHAALKGHEAGIRLLLQKGADIESRCNTGMSPLGYAAYNGYEAAIRLLLEKGAAIESSSDSGITPLGYAALKGHVAVVQILLEAGAVVESKSNAGITPLGYAALKGHESAIKVLITKGAIVESKSNSKVSPLGYAALNGHEAAIRLLLAKGADIESRCNTGTSPLTYAAMNGHEIGIRLLLEKGADIESKNNTGTSPLGLAVCNSHNEAIEILLEKGADIESKDNDGISPLGRAAYNGHEEAINILLKMGAALESTSDSGITPLGYAALNGHEAAIRVLLERGANIESKCSIGISPLGQAAHNGHEAAIRLLLDMGADINSKDNEEVSPLGQAALNGHEAAIRLLLEMGADCESKCNAGISPLGFAAYIGHSMAIQLLLEKGANIESKSNTGKTPLALAAYNGREEAIRTLLDKGADIESKDNEEVSPLGQAAYKGREPVTRRLEKGATIESKSNGGISPLRFAAYDGHIAAINLLLEKGADIESKSNLGISPLGQAAYNGHQAAVQLLIKRGANIESTSNTGITPLGYAALNGHQAAIQLLLENGANIESKSSTGVTPLEFASINGHEAAVQLLKTGEAFESNSTAGISLITNYSGSEANMGLVLEKGLDLELEGNRDAPPHAAEKSTKIIKLLQDIGLPLRSKKRE